MVESAPCPYCGCVGHHIWAGSGGCPGAVSERDRDGYAAQALRLQAASLGYLGAEIARLKNGLDELLGLLHEEELLRLERRSKIQGNLLLADLLRRELARRSPFPSPMTKLIGINQAGKESPRCLE